MRRGLLDDVSGGAHWTITTARDHLSFQREDPWCDYWTARQSLATAMKLLPPSVEGDHPRNRAGGRWRWSAR
jgi:hypothetical protein